jgi:hypothetical protein
MKITLEIDRNSRLEFRNTLKAVEDIAGQTVEWGIQNIAHATAKRMAHKIRPWGFKNLGKFEGSIAKQVVRAVTNANIQGAGGSIESAHESRRNKKGQVPKGILVKGKFPQAPFAASERDALIQKKQANAGIAKASCVDAGNSIGLEKIQSHPLIERHLNKGHGTANLSGNKMKHQVQLVSHVPYIRKALPDRVISSALKEGRVNGTKIIQKEIDKRLKVIEKETKVAAKRYIKFQKSASKFYGRP